MQHADILNCLYAHTIHVVRTYEDISLIKKPVEVYTFIKRSNATSKQNRSSSYTCLIWRTLWKCCLCPPTFDCLEERPFSEKKKNTLEWHISETSVSGLCVCVHTCMFTGLPACLNINMPVRMHASALNYPPPAGVYTPVRCSCEYRRCLLNTRKNSCLFD